MTVTPVEVSLDSRYSHPDAEPASWTETEQLLAGAELYWISSIRPGVEQPHITPLAGAWHDGALWFCSLPQERKVRNLLVNPRCTLLTGSNQLTKGTDLVLEGRAVRVTEPDRIEAAAATFRAKYGAMWDYVVDGDSLNGSVGRAWAFAVAPDTVYAFSKGPVSQTRWRFAR